MLKDFYDLEVWQKAKEMVVLVYRLTEKFPSKEMFGLTDQMRRAGNSICANIAEGFSRFHAKDKIKFYYNARGSVSESVSHALIAKDLNYLSSENVDELIAGFDSIKMMINRMIGSIALCDALRRKK